MGSPVRDLRPRAARGHGGGCGQNPGELERAAADWDIREGWREGIPWGRMRIHLMPRCMGRGRGLTHMGDITDFGRDHYVLGRRGFSQRPRTYIN